MSNRRDASRTSLGLPEDQPREVFSGRADCLASGYNLNACVAQCNMIARLSVCFVLAAGASVSGVEQKTTGVGAKAGVPGVGVPGVKGISPARKDGLKASGAPAPGELHPGDLSKMRDTMRRTYCADGANPTTAPCEVQAFITKVRAEKDAEKRKALLEARQKELAANPRDKAAYAKEFFNMFDG